MKKILIVLTLVVALLGANFSVLAADMEVNVNDKQAEEQKKDGEDKLKKEIEVDFGDQKAGGFKGNGGPMMAGLILDFSSLNDALKSANEAGTEFATFDQDYMLLFGGGGLGGIKDGSRFGGYGVDGKLTTSDGDRSTLTINYGGFLYEKGVLSFETGTDIAVGTLMGGGSAELELVYENLDGGKVEDLIETPKMNRFEKEFVLLEPRINLHQQLGAFVGLDFSAGYLLTYDFGETWKVNEQVIDGPLSNFHAPSYTARLSFGF